MRRAPKPARAARSASDSALRSNALSAVSNKQVFATLGRKRTVNVQQLAKKKTQATKTYSTKVVKSTRSKPTKKEPEIIDAEVISVTPARNVPSTRQFTPQKSISGPKPAALPAPGKKSKSSKSTKKEKTPGMQTVFKATPAVDLNEGPNFGKTTSIIEKTQQPKAPRKKKNA